MAEWPAVWRAHWIWFRPPPAAGDEWGTRRSPGRDAFGLLRRAFELDGAPASARCRVAADARYVLWVNGIHIGRGPVRSQPERATYDEYDLTPHLRAGPNVFAVLVRHYGRPTTSWRPGAPAGEAGFGSFSFEAEIDGEIVVASDTSWRAHDAPVTGIEPSDAAGVLVPPATEGPPPIEVVDLRDEPAGWIDPGFEDSHWRPAAVLRPGGIGTHEPHPPSPYSLLEPRPLPLPAERMVRPARLVATGPAIVTDAHPLAALRGDDPGRPSGEPAGAVAVQAGEWATFDFGEIVCAYPEIALRAEPSTTIDIACGEDVTSDGRAVTAPREWAMRVVAAGRDDEHASSFEPVGFRYLSVAVRSGAAARIEVSGRERLHGRAEGASFASSDPLLDHIWQAGVRTLDLCSLDAFVDCPGREQRAWLGDAYLSTVLSLVVNPDPSMPAWNLRLHAAGRRPDGLLPMVAAGDFSTRAATIPDFTLLWILGLAEYFERTGDAAIIEELLPVAEAALAFFERFRGPAGLLTRVPGWVFIDWAQLERRECMAALDAFHVMALDAFASLADLLGNTGSAARARARAARTREAFERYWDEERTAYVDSADPGGARGRRVSQQTNAVAILAGCAPAARWPAILDRILDADRLVRTLTPGDAGTFAERISRQWQEPPGFDDEENVVLAQPFFAHFLHRALVRAGRVDVLNDSIRRWRAMVERGNGCLEEHWTAEPGLASRCHAWSATPVHDLATYVLGVRPAGPGMRSVSIEPQLGDLAWAEGTVATPHGFLRVSIKRGADPEIETPPGVRVVARVSTDDADTRPLRDGATLGLRAAEERVT
jgi:hypothetical protein